MENLLVKFDEQSEEYEVKYNFPISEYLFYHHRAQSLYNIPKHHTNYVHSIYFSDFTMPSLWENLESSYYKTKYRIRTYSLNSDLLDDEENICFLEIKRRMGRKRCKERAQIDGNLFSFKSFDRLGESPLIHSLFDGKAPFPIFHLVYKRVRFESPLGDIRISIDSDLRLKDYNTDFFGPLVDEEEIAKNTGVIEFKAKELCHIEFAFRQFNIKNEKSFSKFALANQALRYKQLGIPNYGSTNRILSSDSN